MDINQKGFANIILVVVIVILVGAVGYFALIKKSEPVAQQPTPTPIQTKTPISPTPTPKDETANWKVYQDRADFFEFKYPNNFILRNGDHPDYPTGSFFPPHGGPTDLPTSITLVLVLPQNTYPGTNFQSAWFSIALELSDSEYCQLFKNHNNIEKLPQSQTINGIKWYKGATGSAATGTGFEHRIYHTLHDNQMCYEVGLNLATANMGNYEPGTVKAFNETEVWNKLESILSTFKFTK
jgi:hypothetical protein